MCKHFQVNLLVFHPLKSLLTALQYYQYYNELKEAKKYDSLENLINDVNSVVDRLTVEFGTQTDTYFKTLIKNDLFYAYQKSTYFDFDNVRYYQLLRTLYNDDDIVILF